MSLPQSEKKQHPTELVKKKKVLKSLLESKPVTNIWKSLITTSLGVVIILGSLFSSIVMNNSWSDSVWGIAVGLGLLFAPDEILKKLKNFIR